MLLRIAVSMTVEPSSASTVRPAPLESLKVIFGIRKDSKNDFVVDDARLYIVIRAQKPSPVIAGIASLRSRPAPHRRPARVDRSHRRSPLGRGPRPRSEEHTSELQSLRHLVCRLLLEKK